MKHPRHLAPLVVLLMVGCELAFGIKESGSGMAGAGGSSGASTATVGSSSSTSGGPSSSSVGSSATATSSTGTSTAASSSSSTSSSGAVVSFCETSYALGAFLCADFDDGGLGGPWNPGPGDFSSGFDGGVNSANPSPFDGMYSYRFVAPAVATGHGSGRLHKDLPSSWTHLYAEFQSSVCAGAATNGNAAIDFVTIDCIPPGGSNTYGMVRWGLRESGDKFYVFTSGDAGTSYNGGVGATNGDWAQVKIDVTYGDAGNVQFTLGGTMLVDQSYDLSCDGTTQFTIGEADYAVTLPCTVTIDNVLVRVTP